MCDSCVVARINGVLCHEIGCPDMWKDEIRECKWCGLKFKPLFASQVFDEESCYRAYNGIPEEMEVEHEDPN